MNRPGYDPTRRNKNIGTSKSGHGKDNHMSIPRGWSDDRRFYEKLNNPVKISFPSDPTITCLVEPPLPGFKHACTVDDVFKVLLRVPVQDLEKLSLIVLRQPKRKERILAPSWGRLVYWARIGAHSGPAIYLEAQNPTIPLKWTRSLTPDQSIELERLRADGHHIDSDRRSHVIHTSHDSIRCTQLYRTLPHEIGHHVDFLSKVERPKNTTDYGWITLNQLYHSRAAREKEDFANRYADDFREQMAQEGILPFPRITDSKLMRTQGLDPSWFVEQL